MRLKILFQPQEQKIRLPINYQHILQGFIYRNIGDTDFAQFLHDQGYRDGARSFKLFTFSRLNGKCSLNLQERVIEFSGVIEWEISSVVPEFIQGIGQSLLMNSSFVLGEQNVQIEELHYSTPKINQMPCKICMSSPLTVHQTVVGNNGKKRTHYYNPSDPVFPLLIEQNIKNKYKAFYKNEPSGEFTIYPSKISKRDKVVTQFKNFYITGYMGRYELSGDPELVQFALNVGLGARNSLGFGMFNVVDHQ